MKRWLAALLLALMVGPALAQDDASSHFDGIWKGTIGPYPVVACLIPSWAHHVGTYYYLSSRRIISFADDEPGARQWAETVNGDPNGAIWAGMAVKGDRLTGNWQEGSRRLPIALEKQPWNVADGYGSCGSLSFQGPRLEGSRIAIADGNLDGWAYRTRKFIVPEALDTVDISTFELVPTQAGDPAINRLLGEQLPAAGYYPDLLECLGERNLNYGDDGTYHSHTRPTMISSRWLTVFVDYAFDCFGVHGDYGFLHRSFDRESGKAIEPLEWLNDRGAEFRKPGEDDGHYVLRRELAELVVGREPGFDWNRSENEDWHPYEESCREVFREEELWTLGIGREGMHFRPFVPHIGLPCLAVFTVPWPELEPYLSEAGKAGLVALRADEAP